MKCSGRRVAAVDTYAAADGLQRAVGLMAEEIRRAYGESARVLCRTAERHCAPRTAVDLSVGDQGGFAAATGHDALYRTRAAGSVTLRRSRLWLGLQGHNRLAVHKRPTIRWRGADPRRGSLARRSRR